MNGESTYHDLHRDFARTAIDFMKMHEEKEQEILLRASGHEKEEIFGYQLAEGGFHRLSMASDEYRGIAAVLARVVKEAGHWDEVVGSFRQTASIEHTDGTINGFFKNLSL